MRATVRGEFRLYSPYPFVCSFVRSSVCSSFCRFVFVRSFARSLFVLSLCSFVLCCSSVMYLARLATSPPRAHIVVAEGGFETGIVDRSVVVSGGRTQINCCHVVVVDLMAQETSNRGGANNTLARIGGPRMRNNYLVAFFNISSTFTSHK